MEPLSIMMLTVPIYFPIIQSFGYMTPDEREDLLNDALKLLGVATHDHLAADDLVSDTWVWPAPRKLVQPGC